MKNLLKQFASALPNEQQQSLKRSMYRRQIQSDRFVAPEPEFGQLEQWISPGDWVLDVGANIGHYTSRLSTLVGESGRVIAFEPVPHTFDVLSTNVLSFKHRNVSLINTAVTDDCQLLQFSVPRAQTGLNDYFRAQVISQAPADPTLDALSVLGISIDSLAILAPIKLAKIDVEGHEISVLHGMHRLLERDHPVLIVEGRDPEVESLLTSLDYEFSQLADSPNRVFISKVPGTMDNSIEDGLGQQRADRHVRQIDRVTDS